MRMVQLWASCVRQHIRQLISRARERGSALGTVALLDSYLHIEEVAQKLHTFVVGQKIRLCHRPPGLLRSCRTDVVRRVGPSAAVASNTSERAERMDASIIQRRVILGHWAE